MLLEVGPRRKQAYAPFRTYLCTFNAALWQLLVTQCGRLAQSNFTETAQPQKGVTTGHPTP